MAQTVRYPPSTAMVLPVMYDAASVHKNSAAPAQSWGIPGRPSGVWKPISISITSGMSMAGAVIRGLISPGAMALTRIPSLAHRRDRFIVKAIRPIFDEAYPGTKIAERNADIETTLTTLAPPSAL